MWILRSLPALLTILGFLTLQQTGVSAQGFGGDDNLYIPPKLTVENRLMPGPPKIELSESYRPGWLPLLPAVFFDNPGDWTIPERYVQFASSSATADYADTANVSDPWNRTLKYYEILNVLGYRLRAYPDAQLGLRGCHSAEGGESGGVARERALVIREYLERIWDIDTARLPLLPPTRRADTLDSNPLQEEARRVEFVSDHPELLAPVSFNLVGISAMPVMLRAVILPNMPPGEVDSIIFLMLDQSGEVHDRRAIPGTSDSARYEVQVMWEHTREMGDEGMVLQVQVRARDGQYRPSNTISLPISVRRPDPDRSIPSPYHQQVLIPFLAIGDSIPGPFERRAMREAVSRFMAPSSGDIRDGYAVIARGSVGIEEDPGRNGVEVNVLYDTRKVAMENLDPDNRWAGRLWVMVPIPSPEGRGTTWIEYGSEERHAEREQKQEEQLEDRQREREERPELQMADAISNGRARGAISFLRDSVDLPIANEELPPDFDEIRRTYGDPFSQRQYGSTRTEEGITPSIGGSSRYLPLLPEERWYRRGVELMLWTKERIESMVKSFNRLPPR